MQPEGPPLVPVARREHLGECVCKIETTDIGGKTTISCRKFDQKIFEACYYLLEYTFSLSLFRCLYIIKGLTCVLIRFFNILKLDM